MKSLNFFKKYFKKYIEIGILSTDGESLRLEKTSIAIVPLIMGPAGIIWSLIYILTEHYLSASIAFSYAFFSLLNLLYLHKTKNFRTVQKIQMTLMLLIPFFLMWSLGGFALSSYVMIWAFFAPVTYLIYDKNSKSLFWFNAFMALVIFSAFIDNWLIEWHTSPMSQEMIELFFVLNIVCSLSGIYFLLNYIIHQKEKNSDKKIQKKHEALVNSTKQLFDNLSYLQSYKDNIDKNLIVTKTDLDGNITFANKNFYKITGYTEDEVIGKKHNIIKHPDNKSSMFVKLWATITAKKTWHGSLQNMKKDGTGYWIDTTISPILDKDENIVEYIAIRHDITRLIRQQAELTKMLYTDKLTGLQNRNALFYELKIKKKISLILINIDNFSQINDLYGDKFGDNVLIKFSALLKKNIPTERDCKIFRLNGDEFVLLTTTMEETEVFKSAQEFIKNIDSHPLSIGDEEILLSITIGISYEKNSLLLSTANMALKVARRDAKSIVVYNDAFSLNKEYENNIKWIKIIKKAIKDDRIVMFFQPIVNSEDYSIFKYETLIRLIDKDGQVISPFFFLEIAKKAKLYKELTKIVIKKSFEAFKENNYIFSVNLTIDDILDKEINKYIYDLLQEYNIAHRVTFEIVESEVINDFEKVEQFITKVKALGCKIAIDDFGTGYSNFVYLMRLQADFIKIDGSIIKEVVNDKKSALITSSIVAFAQEMNIQTIGEFVESKEDAEKAKALSVNKLQGYYFDQPLARLK